MVGLWQLEEKSRVGRAIAKPTMKKLKNIKQSSPPACPPTLVAENQLDSAESQKIHFFH